MCTLIVWFGNDPLLIYMYVQCNLNYLDLVYPDPRLSGLAGDQKVHYHACTEGEANDLLWM